MSVIHSTDLAREALASESGRYQVWLLTFEHDEFDNPWRFASDGKDLLGFDKLSNDPIYKFVSRSQDYMVCPFALVLMDSQVGNAIPKAKIQVANAIPELSATLQDYKTKIKVKCELVFADEPDEILNSLPVFSLDEVEVSTATISGTLIPTNFFDSIIPRVKLVKAIFPGAFP